MTPDFKSKMRADLVKWKGKGMSAADALHDTEVCCGKSNEEFAVDGKLLVEEVYGGKFFPLGGGGGLGFTANDGTEVPQPTQSRGNLSVENVPPVDGDVVAEPVVEPLDGEEEVTPPSAESLNQDLLHAKKAPAVKAPAVKKARSRRR